MSPDVHPNDPAHGPTHLWDVWNKRDYTHYRDSAPRFVAEFGWQAPPTWATLTRAVHDEPLAAGLARACCAHQKAADGDLKLSRGLAPHLPEPETFDGLALGHVAEPGPRRLARAWSTCAPGRRGAPARSGGS